MRRVTVAEYAPRVRKLCPAGSRDTYGTGFRHLEERFGPVALDQVRAPDLAHQRDEVQAASGRRKVARAEATGRRLRSYKPSAHGRGAAENYVRAVRFFFRCAVEDQLLDRSPASALKAPRRAAAPERPLTEAELAEIWGIATGTGRDPALDRLILTFARHTAARREGITELTLRDLNAKTGQVHLTEKNGDERDLPLRLSIIEELIRFARGRGATCPGDRVFRRADRTPITDRNFDALFDRIDRHTDWTEPLDVGVHWIRHTTLADIEAVAGLRVAAAFAGHADESVGVIGRYTKIPFERLVIAYETVFGPRDG